MYARHHHSRNKVERAAVAAFDEVRAAFEELGNPEDGSIANEITIKFKDGSAVKITVDVGVFEEDV